MYLTHLASLVLPTLWQQLASAGVTARVNDEIVRDVCILGGGASGTYAAIRLKELGYSVALIERNAHLGGHVNTYYDPATGNPLDYGVIAYHNISTVTDFLSSLGVALAPATLGYGDRSIYINNLQNNGTIVQDLPSSVPWANATAVGLAFEKYLGLVQQYPFLAQGYELPAEIPEDLLLPYGEFLQKYDLGAMIFDVSQYVPGFRNLLTVPTLYVMKAFSADIAETFLGLAPPFLSAVEGNQHIYDQARLRLGDDVFLDSTLHGILRHGGGVRAFLGQSHTATAESSTLRSIRAKKLLITIPPKPHELLRLGLALTPEEVRLFSQFEDVQYWAAVLNVTGLPAGDAFLNIDLGAPYAIVPEPLDYGFVGAPDIDDLYVTYYSSTQSKSTEEVQEIILQDLSRFAKKNGFKITGSPSFAAFDSHSPYQLTVSASHIKDGFYNKLNALQGRDNTWWTGAAWQAQDSSLIWNWTEYTLLPKIVASLKMAALDDDMGAVQQPLQEL
ncbi:FAD/NAD(P)-binding domain-containing protein [Cryphonectria parasitica EP155]|uniref:FAD/NAD(P)-binding domain-containing protein n=1 Tax=Cryphonectria parasitica (strain ATCC 38755 / EP155) TaxID=660469 RepID=A0A9P5CR90_CRYP1|nr:FAD/NAD(P)-binding domain-containing protein [Cryphonectria parasitica EP155]KAF3767282.1 FAD/NAD(P)-binding domain-containing protein [Cryphonectria parasitica EP155]